MERGGRYGEKNLTRTMMWILVCAFVAPWAAKGASRGPLESSFTPLVATDADAALADLLHALGEVPEGAPALPAGIDPSLAEYTHIFMSSGMNQRPGELTEHAATLEPGLGNLDAPMLRVMPARAMPMLIGYIHTMETLESLRPLTAEETAALADRYEILWTYVALYPTPQQVFEVERGLKIEVDPAVHVRAAWAEEMREAVWTSLQYRLSATLVNPGEQDRGRNARRLAAASRTLWRSGAEGGGRLYVAAMRYLAAVDAKHENVANLVLVAIHVGGLSAVPRKKHVPAEVREDESYARVDEVIAAWKELEALEGAGDTADKLSTARLLYRRDREQQQRELLYEILKDERGHSEAMTRLAISFAEGSPRLAHDIVMQADPAAPELQDDTLALRFPIQWLHALTVGMSASATGPQVLDGELTAIETLVWAAGDRVPTSTAYSSLLADALRQLWVEGKAIDDVDLGAHIEPLRRVLELGPDEDLYRLLMFATRLSPGFREYELLEDPLDRRYDPETLCALQADRAGSVLAAAVRGLEDEGQLEGIAAEVDEVASSCGEGAVVSKLRGDLVVLRTIHASAPPSLDEAIPYYAGCAASLDRRQASTCRGNLFVLHHAAGRAADARDAMEHLWRCCADHAPTMFLAVHAVGDERLPPAAAWVEQMLAAQEILNEPERVYMCGGSIARRTGEEDLADAYWSEACGLLVEECDGGRDLLECLPGPFIGNGSMTLGLSGSPTAPIAVQYDQQLRLLSSCDEDFVQWMHGGGCEAEPTSSTARSSSASATDSTGDDRPAPGP
jgi:hypothetical protein